jgi:anti-sigma regulatory factor (Ser/Thr protein kinase)
MARLAAATTAADPQALCDRLVNELLPEGEASADDAALLALRSRPLATDRLELDLPADPDALVHARRSLTQWLAAAGASREDAYALSVACGEACANAVEHAYPPGDASFRLCVHRVNGDVEVVVTDSGRWRQRRTEERGRGLDLMRELSDELEITSSEGGTSVRLRRHLTGASG